MPTAPMHDVARIPFTTGARVHVPGWQSWSASGTYDISETPPVPRDAAVQQQFYRPGAPMPPATFQGDGWIAYALAQGPALLWFGTELHERIPVVRLRVDGDVVVVTADSDVEEMSHHDGLAAVVEAFADRMAREFTVPPLRSLAPGWSSWMCFGQRISPAAIAAEMSVARRDELPVDTVQIDDGWFRGLGDWDANPTFGSLTAMATPVLGEGFSLGLWTAPFLVDLSGPVARGNPSWLVDRDPLDLPFWGGGGVGVLDVTHPGAAAHLQAHYAALAAAGTTLHKIDFLYAGALDGGRAEDCSPVQAYRRGLSLIRAAVGRDAVVLGCGAPLLPSLGLVDAMRVSTDAGDPPAADGTYDPPWEPAGGDRSQPSLGAAASVSRARRWQHGRWWTTDSECALAGPSVRHRERWADVLRDYRGLVLSGDRLDGLDERGRELTRELLRPSSPEPMSFVDDLWPPAGS